MIADKLLTESEIEELLLKLIEWNALELNADGGDILIPYVLNDAVECYILLENASVNGELDEDEITKTSVDFIWDDDIKIIEFDQPGDNTVFVRFEKARQITGMYQYHQIGHGWRHEPGLEYLRRLVNLVCVLNDKKNYLGDEACNDEEIWIADLAEFSPLISFSPINESITDWYPRTDAGINAMRQLAFAARDVAFLEALSAYENAPDENYDSIVELLASQNHVRLWTTLNQRIIEASKELDPRVYDDDYLARIQDERAWIDEKMNGLGFEGSYPSFKNAGGEEILFYEQQAFTVMEEEDFKYKFFRMTIKNGDILNAKMEQESFF